LPTATCGWLFLYVKVWEIRQDKSGSDAKTGACDLFQLAESGMMVRFNQTGQAQNVVSRYSHKNPQKHTSETQQELVSVNRTSDPRLG
jgi:hypothetical protein